MFSNRNYSHFTLRLVVIIGFAVFGLALLGYTYIGTFSRYYADDYCISGSVVANGIWKAQIASYTGWSDRYAATFFASLSDVFGPSAVRIWPGLIMALLLLSLTWVLVETIRLLRLEFPNWAMLPVAAAVLFFTVLGSPQRYQTIYWRMGLFTYTLPLVFLTCLIGLIFHLVRKPIKSRRGVWAWMAVCAGLAFLAGGFSETNLTLQVGLLGLAVLGVWFLAKDGTKSKWLSYLLASLIGSLLALLVMLIAPGNAVRQASMPAPPGAVKLATLSLQYAWDFIRYTIKGLPLPTFVVFLYVSLLAWTLLAWFAVERACSVSITRLLVAAVVTPVLGYFLIVCTTVPNVYAESAYPEARALMVPYFVLVCTVAMIGCLIGWIVMRLIPWRGPIVRWGAILALLLLSIYPMRAARQIFLEVPVYRERAATWDARSFQIRLMQRQGHMNIVVPGMDSAYGLMDMNENPATWVNVCAAQYYGVDTITATP
jgi:hypothetical protein